MPATRITITAKDPDQLLLAAARKGRGTLRPTASAIGISVATWQRILDQKPVLQDSAEAVAKYFNTEPQEIFQYAARESS